MELTVGTTLQGSKYVIQGVLRQSDTEVVYKANHTYLDQPVVLRSLAPALQQRADFAQVKQQFMSEVRSQAKQLAQSAAAVLDCFEEGGLPFVVLKFQPESAQPEQTQPAQFPSASIDPAATLTVSQSNSSPHNSSLPSAQGVVGAQASQTEPQADLIQAFDAACNAVAENGSKNGSQSAMVTSPLISSELSSKASPQVRDYEPILFHPVSSLGATEAWSHHQIASDQVANEQVANEQVTNEQVANGRTKAMNIAGSRSPSRRFAKMPIALLAISLIGGCIGMGTGLALRLDATQSVAGKKPRLSLFNREQSFPAAGSWPIQESYSPQPAIEQPIYRTAPPSEYISPSTIQTLPSTSAPLPLAPPLDEKPLPESFNLPEDTEFPPVNPDLKLPAESLPLPELGSTDEIPPPVDRLPPISPDNLLPPTTVTPDAAPPPADNQTMNPPPLKSLPNSSGI